MGSKTFKAHRRSPATKGVGNVIGTPSSSCRPPPAAMKWSSRQRGHGQSLHKFGKQVFET